MKILKLEVRRFGKLEDFVLEPQAGLNTYCRPNEFGKTTLIYFIYYMFYGYTAKMLKKYQPWSGEEMAGSLTFSLDGKEWRIERRHPARGMEKRQIFCRTTGEELTLANTEQPGPYFLGLDGETFLRTFCITQGDLLFSHTDGLDVALKNMAATGDENVSYQTAEDWLNREHTRYMHRGKTRGHLLELEGELSQVGEQLGQIAQQVDEQVEAFHEWEELEKSIPESERATEALRLRLKAAEGSDALKLLERLNAIREKKPMDPPAVKKEQLDALEQAFAAKSQATEAAEAAEQEKNRIADQLRLMGESVAQFGFHALSAQEIEKLQKQGGFPLWIVLLGLAAAAEVAALIVNGWLHLLAAGLLAAAFLPILIKSLARRRLCHTYGTANERQLLEKWTKYCDLLQQQETVKALYETASAEAAVQKAAAESAAAELERQRVATRIFSLEELQELRIQWGVYENSLKQNQTVLQEQALLNGRSREAVEKLAEGAQLTEETAAQVRELLTRAEAEDRALRLRRETLDPRRLEALWTLRTALKRRSSALKKEIRYGREQLTAIQTALDWLKDANEEMNTRFAPQLCTLAGAHLARLTDGKYQNLLMDSKYGISLETAEGTYPLDRFSAGTQDAVYFAFRLAVGGLLSEKVLPMVLDDPFTNLDEERRRAAEELLKTASEERQILYFTCRK